jgi:hypothetical protein
MALEGVLGICMGQSGTLEDDTSRLSVTFLWSWPAIWKWISFLYSQSDKRPSGQWIVTMSMPLRILLMFHSCPNTATHDIITTTPGVFPLVANIWIEQSERTDNDQRARDCSTISLGPAILIQIDLATNAKEFLELAGGDHKKVALQILINTRLACQGGPWITAFTPMVDVCTLLLNSSPEIYNTLLSRGITVDIFKALKQLTSPNQPVSDWQLWDAGRSSIELLRKASGVATGYTWIIQAIQSGLLYSIHPSIYKVVRSCFRRKSSGSPHVSSTIRCIPLLFKNHKTSVLGTCGFSRRGRDSTCRRIWSEWVLFKMAVKEYQNIKARFDEAGKFSQACSSPEVGPP